MREPGTSTAPLVRVVVVDHDGGDLTMRCLESLLATDWPVGALDIVLVDNGSRHSVAGRVKATMGSVRVIEAGANRGFAGGCNLAMRDLDGADHVALVNNDATVEPGWLGPLVAALEADPGVGAACPKILFSSRFVDLTLESGTGVRGLGDRRSLGARLGGARLDGREAFGELQLVEGFWGREHGGGGDGAGAFQWTSGSACLRVPVRADGTLPDCQLLLAADGERPVTLASGGRRLEHRVGPAPAWFEAPLGGQPFDVVNNVGCVLVAPGYGADRGYLEPDDGQFDRVEEVFAWCGAAVLLSRRYLESVGLFDERFFLYYEDFDLSWRGRAQGWCYLFVPTSVVRHVHSASSVEGSRLAEHFVERNRLLALTRNAPTGLAWRAAARHLLITGSYARRDILSPLVRTRRPTYETVRRRTGAFADYLRLLPPALVGRHRLRRRRQVGDRELLAWMTGQ